MGVRGSVSGGASPASPGTVESNPRRCFIRSRGAFAPGRDWALGRRGFNPKRKGMGGRAVFPFSRFFLYGGGYRRFSPSISGGGARGGPKGQKFGQMSFLQPRKLGRVRPGAPWLCTLGFGPPPAPGRFGPGVQRREKMTRKMNRPRRTKPWGFWGKPVGYPGLIGQGGFLFALRRAPPNPRERGWAQVAFRTDSLFPPLWNGKKKGRPARPFRASSSGTFLGGGRRGKDSPLGDGGLGGPSLATSRGCSGAKKVRLRSATNAGYFTRITRSTRLDLADLGGRGRLAHKKTSGRSLS